MSKEYYRSSTLNPGKAASLTAIVAFALAGNVSATAPSGEPVRSERALSERVAGIAERIRLLEPILQRELPPEAKVAQWRN
jgi:hypothetical protein